MTTSPAKKAAYWNMFSTEVSDMRTLISNYGGPEKFRNRNNGHSESFKKQALVELASRLNLQDELERVKKDLRTLQDRLEAASLPANTI